METGGDPAPCRRPRRLKPSYEGWKQGTGDEAMLAKLRLKPSYEGWKQHVHYPGSMTDPVSSLPMRDGN